MSICHNLRTVLFDGENGFMSLRREMNNVRLAEVENTAENEDLKEENIFEQGLNSEIISHTDDLYPSLPPHGMH